MVDANTQTDRTVDGKSTYGNFTNIPRRTGNTSNRTRYKFVRLNNFVTGTQFVDTLHKKSVIGVGRHCNDTRDKYIFLLEK